MWPRERPLPLNLPLKLILLLTSSAYGTPIEPGCSYIPHPGLACQQELPNAAKAS